MPFKKIIRNVFAQLSESLDLLSPAQYTQRSKLLFNATIGQHVRHIIELYICLYNGYETGTVNYEKRKRDRMIETDKQFATGLLKEIVQQISKANKPLYLLTYYDDLRAEPEKISTNYYREIAYNLEHTIHHMALIRVGLRELGDIQVDDSFGVASSTLKYRKQCVQ